MKPKIPRDKSNDYTEPMAQARRDFIEQQTDAEIEHIGKYSIDPQVTQGNIENFIGVAQVPIGLAGPLKVNGEHAQGEFISRWQPAKVRSLPAITEACVY